MCGAQYDNQTNCELSHQRWITQCSTLKTKDDCNNNTYCIWNDKNLCIPRGYVQDCNQFITFDLNSLCGDDYCTLDNGICREKYCSEQITERYCSASFINLTHLYKCIWKNNSCVENLDVPGTVGNKSSNCEAETYLQYQFQNNVCQQCKNLIVDYDRVLQRTYLTDQYTTLYQGSSTTTSENVTSNSSSNSSNQTSTNSSTSDTNQTNSTTNSITQARSMILSAIISIWIF